MHKRIENWVWCGHVWKDPYALNNHLDYGSVMEKGNVETESKDQTCTHLGFNIHFRHSI